MNHSNCISKNTRRGEIKEINRGGQAEANKIAVRYLRDGCVIIYKLMRHKIYNGHQRNRFDIIIQTVDADRSVDESRAALAASNINEAHGLFRTLVKHKVTPCTLSDIISDLKIG